MSWDISVMVLTRRGIKRGGYLGRPSWKADGVDGSPANGLFDHGLDVGQVLAVVDGRESVARRRGRSRRGRGAGCRGRGSWPSSTMRGRRMRLGLRR